MKVVSAIIVAVVFLTLPCATYAAQSGTITVPKVGDHYYWFSYADSNGKQVTTTPRGFKEKKATVELPLVKDAVPKCRLFVLDSKTGNEAMVTLSGKPGETYKFDLKTDDFSVLRKVEVLVVGDSMQPAAVGTVTLTDSTKSVQTRILDPFAKGVVQFTDIPSGQVEVTAVCGDYSATQRPVLQTERQDAIPTVRVPVTGDIETIKPPASSEGRGRAGGDPDESTDRRPGGGMNFPMAFVGLILIVGVVYAAYATLRGRGARFRDVMRKVGVDLPGEPQTQGAPPPPTQVVDPSVCPFCGGRKDPATGACACSVGGSPAGAPVVGSGPRLIASQGAYAGSIFQLDAGTVTIGREEPNTIALPQDSTASRRHARIESSNGQFTIYDEGSSNGTFVNGVRLTEKVLQPGDEIQIGSTKLRFEA